MTLIPYKFHLIFALKGVLSYPVAEKVSNSDILMHSHDGGLYAGCDEDFNNGFSAQLNVASTQSRTRSPSCGIEGLSR